MSIHSLFALSLVALSLSPQHAAAQDSTNAKPATSAEELAKKLSNPVASLISVPFQNNTDVAIGPYNGYRNTTNFQPVIPISISASWNLIARIVLPIISQKNVLGEGSQQTGLSDAVVSAFFSPAAPKNGLIWGAGPVFLVPVATDKFLGTEKFGIGPTALLLKQTNGWTLGALVNQIWSVAGAKERSEVNQFYLQPFINYNYKSGAGLGLTSETTWNWTASTTTSFLVPSVSGVTKLGKQIVSLAIGPRIQVAAPEGSAADFGVRAVVVFVFPK